VVTAFYKGLTLGEIDGALNLTEAAFLRYCAGR
jgi:hypothetical protein